MRRWWRQFNRDPRIAMSGLLVDWTVDEVREHYHLPVQHWEEQTTRLPPEPPHEYAVPHDVLAEAERYHCDDDDITDLRQTLYAFARFWVVCGLNVVHDREAKREQYARHGKQHHSDTHKFLTRY